MFQDCVILFEFFREKMFYVVLRWVQIDLGLCFVCFKWLRLLMLLQVVSDHFSLLRNCCLVVSCRSEFFFDVAFGCSALF